MSKKIKSCTPPLRFPEFDQTKEWSTFTFKDICSFFKGKGISKNDISSNGKIPCIRYGELYTHYKEVINHIISFTNCNIDELIFSKKNDILIPSSGETKNDIATSSCITLNNIAIGSDLHILRTKQNGIFFSYYINHKIRKKISMIAQGDAIVHLYAEQLKNIEAYFPSLPEQQKIADCLSSLDELIEAHEQKLDTLKQHKKGLMQRLFPAEGETMPRWRFPEFRNAGEWVKANLGTLIAVAMCKRVFSEETSPEGDIPFYKIGTLGQEADAFISYALFQNYKNKYKYPRKGEILLTCSGTIGKMTRYSGEDAYYQDSNIVWLENDQNIIINDFLFFFLSKFNWSKLNVTTITRIYGDDLRKILLIFPKNHNEQQKIADCLTALDERIEAQEEKIAALKEHKKGLMQQLFPSL